MRFKAQPVHSLEDATVNFDQLQSLLTSPGAQLAFLQLVAAKQLGVDAGQANAVFPGGTSGSSPVVVAHGLGRVPVHAGATDSAGAGVWFTYNTATTTHVTFSGVYYTTTAGTVPFSWFVIG